MDRSGSVLVIVLLVLMLISIGGISAINLAVFESYVIRNSGLYRQNLFLAETAAEMGARIVLNERDPSRLEPGARDWLWDMHEWLSRAGISLPDKGYAVFGDFSEETLCILEQRGEAEKDTLRWYAAGWKDIAGESIRVSKKARWRKGIVVGVYDSKRYGRAWVEIGVVKKF